MRERPILFSGPMVRALLAGTKTQTRRAIKPQPYVDEMGNACWNGWNYGQDTSGRPLFKTLASPIPLSRMKRVLCPYGQPGDRLWVREAWAALTTGFAYRADPIWNSPPAARWIPSIHMPRAASRITLEVTEVRVERLQDISEADAVAEGAFTDPACPAYDAYRSLWESINGPGSWDANPWVWVVEFQRVGQQGGGRESGAA